MQIKRSVKNNNKKLFKTVKVYRITSIVLNRSILISLSKYNYKVLIHVIKLTIETN